MPFFKKRRTEDIELPDPLPDVPPAERKFFRNPNIPSDIRKNGLLYGGVEGMTPWELASQTIGPLSNERSVGNYLLKQFEKSFYNPDGSWKHPQSRPLGIGGRWLTK